MECMAHLIEYMITALDDLYMKILQHLGPEENYGL